MCTIIYFEDNCSADSENKLRTNCNALGLKTKFVFKVFQRCRNLLVLRKAWLTYSVRSYINQLYIAGWQHIDNKCISLAVLIKTAFGGNILIVTNNQVLWNLV